MVCMSLFICQNGLRFSCLSDRYCQGCTVPVFTLAANAGLHGVPLIEARIFPTLQSELSSLCVIGELSRGMTCSYCWRFVRQPPHLSILLFRDFLSLSIIKKEPVGSFFFLSMFFLLATFRAHS